MTDKPTPGSAAQRNVGDYQFNDVAAEPPAPPPGPAAVTPVRVETTRATAKRTKWQWIPSRVQSAVFICPRCSALVQMECMGEHQDWHRRTEGD